LIDLVLPASIGSGARGEWNLTILHRNLIQTWQQPRSAGPVLRWLLVQLDATDAAGIATTIRGPTAVPETPDERGVRFRTGRSAKLRGQFRFVPFPNPQLGHHTGARLPERRRSAGPAAWQRVDPHRPRPEQHLPDGRGAPTNPDGHGNAAGATYRVVRPALGVVLGPPHRVPQDEVSLLNRAQIGLDIGSIQGPLPRVRVHLPHPAPIGPGDLRGTRTRRDAQHRVQVKPDRTGIRHCAPCCGDVPPHCPPLPWSGEGGHRGAAEASP
jgi:hypothetical protein